MKIKAIEAFYDLEAGITRQVGDEFIVSDDRGLSLISRNNKARRPLCRQIEVEPKAEAKKSRKKKEV